MISKVRTRRGFTLIELIVVITIIAVMTSVVTPAYFRYWDKSKFESAATTLVEALSFARDCAIQNDVSTRVLFTSSDQRVHVSCPAPLSRNDGPVADQSSSASAGAEDRDFILYDEFAISDFRSASGRNRNEFRFNGDGTSDGAEIMLISSKGYSARVTVSASNGSVTMEFL